MSAITIPDEGTIAYSNFQWSRPRTITYPGNLIRTQTYDPLMRAATIKIKNASDAVLMDYGYTYDAVGNITKKTTEHGAYQYGYDPLDRLTSADYPNGANNDQINTTFAPNTFPFKDDQFTYDLLGNRITDQAQTTTAPWQYNANNELLNSALNQYAYNDNGSTVEKKQPDAEIEQRYVYNTEERLAEVKDASDQSIATYYYDPFGRRLWKTVAANHPGNDSASPKTTYLYYSDEGYAAEYTHAGNHPNSEASITPTLSQLYLFAPEGLWSTDPIALKQAGETDGWRYTETDHLGTPHGLISKTGTETTELRANAFGETEVTGEAMPFRFAGQVEDDEAGGYYNFHRDYLSNVGRYGQSDPLGIGGDRNSFAYVDLNPGSWSDPTGEKRVDCGGGCYLRIESDPHKGLHAHWECPNGSSRGLKGCIKIDGTACDGSGPPNNSLCACLQKSGFPCAPVPAPEPAPVVVCGENCKKFFKDVAVGIGAAVTVVVVICLAPVGVGS